MKIFLMMLICAFPSYAKQVVGIEAKSSATIYTGANSCYFSSTHDVIHVSDVHMENGNSVLVAYLMKDKSTMFWRSIYEKFDINDIEKRIKNTEKEHKIVAAGSPAYILVLYFSDGSSARYVSPDNELIITVYHHLEELAWSIARSNIPKTYPEKFNFDIISKPAIDLLEKIKK